MKKLLFIPLFFSLAATLWYCQKSTDSYTDSSQSSFALDREEEYCTILDPGANPTCNAKIRVRCIKVASGQSYTSWSLTGKWYKLEGTNGEPYFFSLLNGGLMGAQPNVWYDLPDPVLKQSILDSFCPGRGNVINCLVHTPTSSTGLGTVVQWSMYVDILSGGKNTTYLLHGADGILTPFLLDGTPTQIFAFDATDVDFLDNCNNSGFRFNCQSPPGYECAECILNPGSDTGGH